MIILNVSREGYDSKQTAKQCLKSLTAKKIGKEPMAFQRMEIQSISHFLHLAVNGHSFCNLFDFDEDKKYKVGDYEQYPIYKSGANKGCMKMAFKSDAFFQSAQAVFIDVDYTKFKNVEEYINSLTYKPSCCYMSYSDNVAKNKVISRRFHLVYFFNDCLDRIQFKAVSCFLTNQIEEDVNEPMEDKCGCVLSQYMNGCFGNNESYNTGIIYNYSDISSVQKFTKCYSMINNNTSITHNTNYTICEKVGQSYTNSYYRLLADINRLPYDEVYHEYRNTYNYFYRKEQEVWIDNLYQFVDDDYFSLYWNVNKIKDGQHRRKKVFERICLRRIINPDVDADTLLWNAFIDIEKFVDNTDKVLNSEYLDKAVKTAMEYSLDKIQELYSENIAWLKSRRPKSGIILKRGVAKTIKQVQMKKKNIRYAFLDEYYNENLDVKENMNYINGLGSFKFSAMSLYRYCEERNIDTTKAAKNKEAEIMSMYDFSKSIRENMKVLEQYGVTVSRGKLNTLVNKYKTPLENVHTSDSSEVKRKDVQTIKDEKKVAKKTNTNVIEKRNIDTTLKTKPELYYNAVFLDNYFSNWD